MKKLSIKLTAMVMVLSSFVGCSEVISEVDVEELIPIIEETIDNLDIEIPVEVQDLVDEIEETETVEETDVVDDIEETDAVEDIEETDVAEDIDETDVVEDIEETDAVEDIEETETDDDIAEIEEIAAVAEIEETIVEEAAEETVVEEVVEETVVEEVVEETIVEEVVEETVVEEIVEEVVVETPVTTTVATNVTPTTVPDAQVKSQIYSQLVANAHSPTQLTVYGTAVPASSYMYRNMLTSEEQSLYDQLYNGLVKAETNISYSTSLSSDYLNKVSMYVYLDHPELIWINLMGYSASSTIFTPTYNGAQSLVSTYYDTMATILANAKDLPSDMDKIKYIQNYISYHTKFDVSYVSANDSQTAYSCLVGKRTVCSGYAKAFQHCMQLLGIPTTSVVGATSNGSHVWNLVYLGGEYYNMDVNWDDWSSDPSQYNYSYFMVTDAQLTASRASHVRDSISSGLPRAYGTTYSYKNYFG